jgi:hypothetical protein
MLTFTFPFLTKNATCFLPKFTFLFQTEYVYTLLFYRHLYSTNRFYTIDCILPHLDFNHTFDSTCFKRVGLFIPNSDNGCISENS